MVVKSKLKKKPKKTIRQKQTQKQIQNVNQIVRVYLGERAKIKKRKTAPRKNLKGVGTSNLNMMPYFQSQNPLMNTYPLQQPYNPNFIPRTPQRQPQAVSTRPNQVPNTAPIRSQIPPSQIPPSIDVATNPLVAPIQPVNNFPNLQHDNANNILPFMDEPNQVIDNVDTQLPFMDESNDDVRLADTQLPFMDETNNDVRLADFNDINIIGNRMKPKTKFKTGTADQDTIRLPSPDTVPSYVGNVELNRPVKAPLPFYMEDPVEDQLAMDFNMGLGYSSAEKPLQIPLLPDKDLEDAKLLYDLLGGGAGAGRRPSTLAGYNKANKRLKEQNRPDRSEFVADRSEFQQEGRGRVYKLTKKKPLRIPE